MELNRAIGIEDALDCMSKGITREQFIGCVKPEFRAINAEFWDEAEELIRRLGSRRRAINFVEGEINIHRTMDRKES